MLGNKLVQIALSKSELHLMYLTRGVGICHTMSNSESFHEYRKRDEYM